MEYITMTAALSSGIAVAFGYYLGITKRKSFDEVLYFIAGLVLSISGFFIASEVYASGLQSECVRGHHVLCEFQRELVHDMTKLLMIACGLFIIVTWPIAWLLRKSFQH